MQTTNSQKINDEALWAFFDEVEDAMIAYENKQEQARQAEYLFTQEA